MRDYSHLIGIPFEWGARGPDKYDCLGLLIRLMAEDGVTIPDYRSPGDQEKAARMLLRELQSWRSCEQRPGVAVVFRVDGLGSHVGYVIDHSRFIHTMEHIGGIAIERLSLWKSRIMGFYEYVGHPEH